MCVTNWSLSSAVGSASSAPTSAAAGNSPTSGGGAASNSPPLGGAAADNSPTSGGTTASPAGGSKLLPVSTVLSLWAHDVQLSALPCLLLQLCV